MFNERFLWRYGSHVIVGLVSLLLFIAVKTNFFDQIIPITVSQDQDEAPLEIARSGMLLSEEGASTTFTMSDVPILTNNSISPALDPLTFQGQEPEHEIITYTVQRNDTPISIAEKFDIQPETILGGNPLLSEESSALQTGTVLIILPLDGVLHDVRDGDSLESVAQLYGVSEDDIVGYEPNNLEFPYRLYPGTQILVPGAVREIFVWTAPSLPSRPQTSDSVGSGVVPVVQGTGFFIWPVGNRRITQYYWYGHQAIDIASPEGSTVVASDTGTITWAGWNVYGYGNLVVVNHGNGYETYYGHLSSINVLPGQVVQQGSVLGASGNTGRSSGPHLHFEIRYFNSLLEPLAYLG